ncbi:tyrosine-type recombinase/integrase, partial [Thermodesulfobacteriota bacterium]
VRRKGFPKQVKTFQLKRDADKWARKIEREMDEGSWRDLKDAHKILFKDALDRYLNNVSTQKRPSTYLRDKLSASHLGKRLGHLSLVQVTPSKVASYRDKRLKEVSPHSVRIELALLSHLFNKAKREWKVGNVDNPVSQIDKPDIPEGRCPMLTQAQLERLLDECSKTNSELLVPFVLLALHTGARSKELRTLRWEQLNLEEGFFSLIGKEIKTHRRRTIPMTGPAKKVFQDLAAKAKVFDMHGKPTGLIFPAIGNPNKPRDMHKTFDVAVRRAGLGNLPGAGKFRIHDLRHCCGSALIMKGVDLETVRKLLGHRDITTTQRYLHVVDDHMANAISKINSLGVPNNNNADEESNDEK